MKRICWENKGRWSRKIKMGPKYINFSCREKNDNIMILSIWVEVFINKIWISFEKLYYIYQKIIESFTIAAVSWTDFRNIFYMYFQLAYQIQK